MSAAPVELPRWADTALVPLVSVAAALLVAGLVVLGIGENPLEATALLLRGALGSAEGIGFTLYYATNFIFTGLAVAVAFHAGLFNIGGEGQATVAGICAALACGALSAMPGFLSVAGFLAAPLAILAAAAGGAAYAFIPGWLQAKRGSHVVITTIDRAFRREWACGDRRALRYAPVAARGGEGAFRWPGEWPRQHRWHHGLLSR